MALPTLEDLQNQLERTIAWRKKEISSLRNVANQSAEERSYFFRAGLVLLCAHWEGYLRAAMEAYVDHAFSQGLRVRELSAVLVAVSYFTDVKNAAKADYPGSADHHVRLASRIQRGTEEVCAMPAWEIRTEGNPGSEAVQRLLTSVGLDERLGMDVATWEATRVFIDTQVVRDRHLVAHGEGFKLSKSEFIERAERISKLLETVLELVLDAAKKQLYKAPAAA